MEVADSMASEGMEREEVFVVAVGFGESLNGRVGGVVKSDENRRE